MILGRSLINRCTKTWKYMIGGCQAFVHLGTNNAYTHLKNGFKLFSAW